VAELRALRVHHPELADAVDLHLGLLEVQRRIQARVPTPWFEITADTVAQHHAQARPLLDFERIPLDVSDLRLAVRQTADVLRRFGALDRADYERVQTVGRDPRLLDVAREWFRDAAARQVATVGVVPSAALEDGSGMIGEVLALAMRPFLARCAEVLQQRPEMQAWGHPLCALCFGEPDLAVITPAAERHLLCGRCGLQWNWEPLACPFCRNGDRTRITSFATPDGLYRVYGCDACRRYLKAFDGRHASRAVMPVVDAVATLPLDAAAQQRGYSAS
jgi:formate dehydrogenase maturation protein FdhE